MRIRRRRMLQACSPPCTSRANPQRVLGAPALDSCLRNQSTARKPANYRPSSDHAWVSLGAPECFAAMLAREQERTDLVCNALAKMKAHGPQCDGRRLRQGLFDR